MDWKTLLTVRTPRYNDQNQLMGITTQSIDITNTIFSHHYLNLFKNDNGIDNRKSKTYILNSDHCPFTLTKRQETCLYFLVRGNRIKDIASILQLSPRTIEDHVQAILIKLNCFTKKELIEKAIDHGYLFYLPENISYSS